MLSQHEAETGFFALRKICPFCGFDQTRIGDTVTSDHLIACRYCGKEYLPLPRSFNPIHDRREDAVST